MRKLLFIGIIIMVIIVAILNIKDDKKEIRVRVIPNSDEAFDLRIKEKAKDITTYYLKEAYDKDYNTFENNIRTTMKKFESTLKKELKQNVEVSLSNHTLYNKTYNNSAVKNTSELTLYVILGSGNGSNWWGTVYPEFLLVNSSEEVKYESLILSIFNKLKGE
ncbi:MAG: stage II sporulation protein R [Anaeroplasmataceae bacterium]|nr:stage II sporulation protein R [Anaeroplasmataceae bacterium]